MKTTPLIDDKPGYVRGSISLDYIRPHKLDESEFVHHRQHLKRLVAGHLNWVLYGWIRPHIDELKRVLVQIQGSKAPDQFLLCDRMRLLLESLEAEAEAVRYRLRQPDGSIVSGPKED